MRPNMLSGRRVFEAGARSNWHSHPNGQLILNESGSSDLHQVRGGPIERLAPGDTLQSSDEASCIGMVRLL